MAFFLVTMHHPDGPGWGKNVQAHVAYLQDLIAAGKLRASGPVKGDELRGGALIFTAADRAEVMRLIEDDPFAKEGLVAALTVTEWDPMFGAFADDPARN